MLKKKISDEALFRKELKQVRKKIEWQKTYLPAAKKYHLTEEVGLRTELLEKLTGYETRLVHILDGIKKAKSGNVYFTKDAECRYKDRQTGA